MSLSELQKMVLGISRSYQAAGRKACVADIHAQVVQLKGEVYSPGDVENAIKGLERALQARAARRAERDVSLSQMLAEMRQAPSNPTSVVSGAMQSAQSEPLQVSVERFDDHTDLVAVQQPGTSLLDAAAAYAAKDYYIDSDLKEAPGAGDVLPKDAPPKVWRQTIEWGTLGKSRSVQNRDYAKGREEANLLVLGLMEADQRTKGKVSVFNHNGTQCAVRGKFFKTAEEYRVAGVDSSQGGVLGYDCSDAAGHDVAMAFASHH